MIKNTEPIRVLQVPWSISIGGAETMLMRMFRNINTEKVVFDFYIIKNRNKRDYAEEIVDLGGEIHIAPSYADNLILYYKTLYKTIKDNNYNIVHVHKSESTRVFLDLIVAWFAGAKIRISHSHSTSFDAGKFRIILHKFFRFMLNAVTTKRLTCGEDAAKWLYGKKNEDAQIINLPIETSNYKFSNEKRMEYRAKFGFGDELVFVHVGRFTEQKNHKKLIDIFENIIMLNQNVKLVLMGEGQLANQIVDLCKTKGISDNVIFTGNIDNVAEYLIAGDAFILPSLYEGFPTVMLEAQAAGLLCFMSDTITEAIKLTDLVHSIPLNEKDQVWAKIIMGNVKRSTKYKREKYSEIIGKDYDAKAVAKKIEDIYLNE